MDKAKRIEELKQDLEELYRAAEEMGDCFWCAGCGNGDLIQLDIMRELAALGDQEGLEWMADEEDVARLEEAATYFDSKLKEARA